MLQNRETDKKKKFTLRASNKAWKESRYVLTILQVNILSTIDLFFCASDLFLQTRKHCVQVRWHYCQQSGREKESSARLRESIAVYLHHVWVVGSRQPATVISLWFAELDCDWSMHNWPVRMK